MLSQFDIIHPKHFSALTRFGAFPKSFLIKRYIGEETKFLRQSSFGR
jgi:uncharacterized protein (DUF924 family)